MKINEDTLVPISMVLLVSGCVFWLSSLYSVAAENKSQIGKIYEVLDTIEEDRHSRRTQIWTAIRDQDKRLARIEGKLDTLIELQSKKLKP